MAKKTKSEQGTTNDVRDDLDSVHPDSFGGVNVPDDNHFDDNSGSDGVDARAADLHGDEPAEEISDDGFGFDIQTATDSGEAGEETQAAEAARIFNFQNLDKAARERAERLKEIRATHTDIVVRAKAIAKSSICEFPETVSTSANGLLIVKPLDSDLNRFYCFDLLYGPMDEGARPYLNEFSGKLTAADGDEFSDQTDLSALLAALSALGMKGQRIANLRATYQEWALTARCNPLMDRIEECLPEWDGKERIQASMTKLFGAFDTPITQEMGWYFWTSLYSRMMHPGCMAPVILSLFGSQNAGKSYFSTRLVRVITGREESGAVGLDLAEAETTFLRRITGQSIVANIGEMTGFGRAELNKIKDFSTRTSDMFDYKFKDPQQKPRQWIAVMDGNKYEGLQRDVTGNRRFYPVFVGQKPDENGRPCWQENYRCELIVNPAPLFDKYVWLCLAEAKAWLENNGGTEAKPGSRPAGVRAYEERAGKFSSMVGDFSRSEMARDSGTVSDVQLENNLYEAIQVCDKTYWRGRLNRSGMFGVVMYAGPLMRAIQEVSRTNRPPIHSHLDTKMARLGAEVGVYTGNRPGYLFQGWDTIEAFEHHKNGFLATFFGEESGVDEDHSTGGAKKSKNRSEPPTF